MKHSRDNDLDNRHGIRTPLIILTIIALLAAIGFGVYGLFFAAKPDAVTEPTHAVTSASTPSPSVTVEPVPNTTDPEVFARYVAETLFTWDTAINQPTDVTDKLIAVADPLGEETAGLISDATTYLPDAATWQKLRGYATKQWITIDSATVPGEWREALDQAASDQLLPGSTAYTISGIRHRSGVYKGEPTSTEHPVSFTVFITCAPSFPECHLLRLSQLDKPLK